MPPGFDKLSTLLHPQASWERKGHRPPLAWPQNGQVKVEKLSLRYRSDLDLVLKDITFTVEPGQKVI